MIRYALLGLLREYPDYGYNLRRRFDEQLGLVWRLNSGQVYQGLRLLQRSRLVETANGAAGVPGPGGRGRCLFAITPKGERALERWLGSALRRAPHVRDEVLLRLLACGHVDGARARQLVDKRLRLYRKHVERLEVEQARLARSDARASVPTRVTAEAALRHAEANVRWLEVAARLLVETAVAEADAPAA